MRKIKAAGSTCDVDELIGELHIEFRELALFDNDQPDEVRRMRLVELLEHALFQAQSDKESHLDYLTTIERGLRKQAKKGETCASLLKRTQKAIEEWEASA